MTEKAKQRRHRTKPVQMPARFEPGFVQGLDGRFAEVKALKARLDALVNDLGGAEALSHQQHILAERATFLSAILETKEAGFLRDGQIDLAAYSQTLNTLLGTLRALGLRRVAKPVPELQTYIAQHSEGESS